MKKRKAWPVWLLAGLAVLAAAAFFFMRGRNGGYPGDYERYYALVGEERDAVLDALGLEEDDLTEETKGLYATPCQAEYGGHTFRVYLEFDMTRDRLWGFEYRSLWEDGGERAAEEAAALIRQLKADLDPETEVPNYQFQDRRLSDMTEEELAAALVQEQYSNADVWLLGKETREKMQDYLAELKAEARASGDPRSAVLEAAEYLNFTAQPQVHALHREGQDVLLLRLRFLPDIASSWTQVVS